MPDPERSRADQRLSEARVALRLAQQQLLEASNLLEAAPGIQWGLLSPQAQRERRLIVFGAHLAWAKIDQCWKKIVGRAGPDGSAREDEGDRQGQDQDAELQSCQDDPSGH